MFLGILAAIALTVGSVHSTNMLGTADDDPAGQMTSSPTVQVQAADFD